MSAENENILSRDRIETGSKILQQRELIRPYTIWLLLDADVDVRLILMQKYSSSLYYLQSWKIRKCGENLRMGEFRMLGVFFRVGSSSTLPAPFALAMFNASYGTVPVHVACLLLLPSTVYSPRLLSFNTMFLVSNSYIACGKTCACSSKSTIHGANIMSDTIRPSSSERKRRRVDKSQCTSTSKRTGSELSGLSPFQICVHHLFDHSCRFLLAFHVKKYVF